MIDILTIMSQRFPVRYSPAEDWDDHGMGRSDEKRGIIIDSSLAPEQMKVVTVHEALHIMASMGGYEPDEPLVCFLGCAVFSLIRDNPELVAWVQDEA
jgi:hypothetical protein